MDNITRNKIRKQLKEDFVESKLCEEMFEYVKELEDEIEELKNYIRRNNNEI